MLQAQVDLQAVAAQLSLKAESFLARLPVFLVAIVAVVIAWWVGRWLSQSRLLDRTGRHNPFLQDLIRTAVRWAVLVLGLVVALEVVGAAGLVGAVLGTAGVLGVAIGFAFKDILENYLAGVLMSLRQPFGPRDHVVINGNEGVVVALTSRATVLMTLDGNHLRLPNALVFRSVILNYTRNPLRRFEFDVGIGNEEDMMHASQVGTDALAGVEGVQSQPPPRMQVIELGDSTVRVRFQAWTDQRSHDFLLVRSESIRVLKRAFDAGRIDMPTPIYQVHIEKPSGGSGAGAAMRPEARDAAAGTPVGKAAAIDTRRVSDVLDQVDADRRSACAPDLLDPDAPRE